VSVNQSETRAESFVGEPLIVEGESISTAGMMAGVPGLPRRFTWRDRSYAILEVLQVWKETGDCRHGSGERYLRKHWFRVRTDEGLEMKLYFERQRGSSGGSRWRLYSVSGAAGEAS